MENNNLLLSIKNGDDKAFETLLNQHHNMIYKIIYGLNLEKGDYKLDEDSLFQEGSIALYKAVFSFEENNNMAFTSYAYMVIRARIRTYIRDNYRYLEKEAYSIDNIENLEYLSVNKSTLVSENPVEYHREKQFESHLNEFVSKLNNEDQEIFRLRSEDYTYKQIAERLNIKAKKVDNRLRVLRERLKRHLKENEE